MTDFQSRDIPISRVDDQTQTSPVQLHRDVGNSTARQSVEGARGEAQRDVVISSFTFEHREQNFTVCFVVKVSKVCHNGSFLTHL